MYISPVKHVRSELRTWLVRRHLVLFVHLVHWREIYRNTKLRALFLMWRRWEQLKGEARLGQQDRLGMLRVKLELWNVESGDSFDSSQEHVLNTLFFVFFGHLWLGSLYECSSAWPSGGLTQLLLRRRRERSDALSIRDIHFVLFFAREPVPPLHYESIRAKTTRGVGAITNS